MKFDTFLNNFELLTDAPKGMQKIRELILQLAVQGKLVSQDPKDEKASIQSKNFKIEKELLIKEKKIKKSKLSPIKPEEFPFQIPDNWEWVKIGEAMNLINGRAFKPSEWSSTGLPIIRIQNLNNHKAPFNYCDFEVDERFHVRNSDFLISWSGTPGTSFGAFIWNRGHAILNQHIFLADLFGEVYNKDYLKFAINSRLNEMIAQAHGGVGLKHITKGKLENLILSLPPLNEQERIVAKVDQLMALCDELEARQQKKHEQCILLNNAALDKLLTAPTSEEFAQYWQRICDNFDLLYDVPETVGQLRQAILQLGVQGKLVAQDINDETASTLLKKILIEKDRLVKEKKTKKFKHILTISPHEMPFNLPNRWKWVRFDTLLVFGPINGYSPNAVEYTTNVISLTLSATTSGKFNGIHSKYIDEQIDSDSYLWLEDSDILIQRGNSLKYVGIAAVYNGLSNKFIYPDLMMKVRVTEYVNVDYIHKVLNCNISRKYFQKNATGTSGSMPKINQATLRNLPIPLPPLNEQKRIVAKVDLLIALCNELEAGLVQAQTEGGKLMEAVVHHVLAE